MTQLLLLSALLLGPAASAEEIRVVLSGKVSSSLDAYRVGTAYYLDASQAGALYRAQVYRHALSGRVQMSLRGRQVQFLINSDEARVGSKAVKLSRPVLIRLGKAFIPLEFFLSEEFSDLAGMDSRFDAGTGLLTVDRRVTVGPLRWFSYKDHTRITLEIRSGLSCSVSRRGRSGVDVTIPFGRIEGSENAFIEDGVVQSLQLRQEPALEPRLARLLVKLERGITLWASREEPSPRRLVIDVFKSAEAAKSAREETAVPQPSEKTMKAPAPDGASAKTRRKRIVIDAGHGGKDEGTSGRHRTREKVINLKAALELAQLLREEGAFEVLLIRGDDGFVRLSERSRKANDFQADLFISLHCNGAKRHTERGFEVYFLSEQASDPESQRVADVENAVLALEGKAAEQEVTASLLSAMAKTEFINDAAELAGLIVRQVPRRVDLDNRGVKQAAFYVLRGTNAPAVLVEMGFLTNVGDETRLESARYRRRLVEGLYAGILDFAKRHHWPLGR